MGNVVLPNIIGDTAGGTLTVATGTAGVCTLNSTNAFVGRNLGSYGVAIVTGSGNVWNQSSDLLVGLSGDGTVTVSAGGLVDTTDDGFIAISDVSTGIFTVTGTDSRWDIGDDLYVGSDDLGPGGGNLSVAAGGIVTVGGNLRIRTSGTFTFGNGTLSADQADLGGTLNVVSSAGDPSVRGQHEEVTVLTANTRNGNFATVQYNGDTLIPTFGPDADGSFRSHQGNGLFRNVTYTATSVEFQNLFALEGDTDGDKDVDMTDYMNLSGNFDPTGASAPHPWEHGNSDGDSDVDLADYIALSGNFSPGGYSPAAIPEPSTFILSILGLIGLGFSGRSSGQA